MCNVDCMRCVCLCVYICYCLINWSSFVRPYHISWCDNSHGQCEIGLGFASRPFKTFNVMEMSKWKANAQPRINVPEFVLLLFHWPSSFRTPAWIVLMIFWFTLSNLPPRNSFGPEFELDRWMASRKISLFVLTEAIHQYWPRWFLTHFSGAWHVYCIGNPFVHVTKNLIYEYTLGSFHTVQSTSHGKRFPTLMMENIHTAHTVIPS